MIWSVKNKSLVSLSVAEEAGIMSIFQKVWIISIWTPCLMENLIINSSHIDEINRDSLKTKRNEKIFYVEVLIENILKTF